MRPRRRIFAFVDLAVVVAIVWLAYLALPYGIRMRATRGIDRPFDEMKFDQAAWISKKPWAEHAFSDAEPMRALMVKDLIRRHLPKGTPRNEVEHLLGLPDERSNVHGYEMWSYDLGTWSHGRRDGHRMTIRFDENRHVARSWWH